MAQVAWFQELDEMDHGLRMAVAELHWMDRVVLRETDVALQPSFDELANPAQEV
jgi:hypothetical protein